MSAVILQDEIVHYEVLGRGKPLVFLHGWVGSWRYWIPTMQAASVSFRTYAIDLWGFGDSGKNPSYYSLDNQVTLLDQFLQEMGIGKIALIGHGLGAMVGLLFALRHRRLVDRMMVVGLPNGNGSMSPRLISASPVELAEWLLVKSVVSEAVRGDVPKADPRAIQSAVEVLQQLDTAKVANSLELPCLMVYGASDPVVLPPTLDTVLSLPEHIHSVVFEGSGHFPMLDETTKFNRLLVDFLALSSGESPRHLQLKEEWKRRVR
jgi:pimeloyl-ACP methyl ester carboxylesterase